MADEVKRLHFFEGQFLREADFTLEQEYHIAHQRDHNRLLHTPGIADGLDVPTPPAGSSSVTVNAGIAYDDQGRRIVLANNSVVNLAQLAPDQAAFVTVAYRQVETDQKSDTGVTGNTRFTEGPLLEALAAAPPNPNEKLVLARVSRTGTTVGAIDKTMRLTAGVRGGDLAVSRLTLRSDTIAPPGWATLQLGASKRADLNVSLRVVGDVSVTGSLSGTLPANSIATGPLADNAVTELKLAANAVSTRTIADSAVTAAKIADNSVGTAELSNGSVTDAKLDPNTRRGMLVAFLSYSGLTSTIKNKLNVTSVTKVSTGRYDITWSIPVNVDGPYVATAIGGNLVKILKATSTATLLQVAVTTVGGGPVDDDLMVMVAM